MNPTTNSETLKSMQTAQTRGRLLHAAIELFNERGTVAVNTHHIAEHAGISPGNLYYHFKNKEEMIREIFTRMEIFSESEWSARGPRNPKVGIMDFMRFFMGNLKRYRFFFREFSRLIHADPLLAKQWQQAYKMLASVMRGAVHLWTTAGILKKFSSPDEVDAFIDNCWVILTFSSIYAEAKGSKSRKDEGKYGDKYSKEYGGDYSGQYNEEYSEELFLRFLYPYHTLKGQRALDLYF